MINRLSKILASYQEEGKEAQSFNPGENTKTEWCEPASNEEYGKLGE